MLSRREFLKLSALAGAALVLPVPLPQLKRKGTPPNTYYTSPSLSKFTQPLRGVGPSGIPVAVPDSNPAPVTGAIHYTLDIQEYKDKLHPQLGPTTLWGYRPTRALGVNGHPVPAHLGGILVVQKGVPIQLTFTNKLPRKHILPVDTSANFPDAAQHVNSASVHLHGGFVPWISDGGPMATFGPGGFYGPSTQVPGSGNIFKLLNPGLQPGQAEYYYPNNQSARLMWYHDHAHDTTRLNAYAGIASAYIIRDAFEASLIPKGLPDFVEKGGREIPIIIQDKVFVDASDIHQRDPTWPGPPETGSLWYPHVYDPDRWTLGDGQRPVPEPSVVPEMFGDTMLANGTVYPVARVEPRRYRLRILNACQARFLNLQLYVDDGSADGITLEYDSETDTYVPTNKPGPEFLVIGTEGGFLPKPALVPSNQPLFITVPSDGSTPTIEGGSLVTAPAERWDVIVDFSGFAGKRVIVYNDAPAPFPAGDPENDFFPGSPNPTPTNPGSGPNTRQIMRFDVGTTVTPPADLPLGITTDTDLKPGNDPLLAPIGTTTLKPGLRIRRVTLNEDADQYGRLIQLLGTNVRPPNQSSFGRAYMDHATETPLEDTTEVWRIYNLTGDTHPIHFHLVNVQVISRQPFDANNYNGTAQVSGPRRPPDATEAGWKETVKANPGEVTTVIMRWKLPQVPFQVPLSPNANLGVAGYEYVWHCHILDHEEHDMMRPLVVRPKGAAQEPIPPDSITPNEQ